MSGNQENFKGKCTVATILSSCVEVTYHTSRVFIAKPAKYFHKACVAFLAQT